MCTYVEVSVFVSTAKVAMQVVEYLGSALHLAETAASASSIQDIVGSKRAKVGGGAREVVGRGWVVGRGRWCGKGGWCLRSCCVVTGEHAGMFAKYTGFSVNY